MRFYGLTDIGRHREMNQDMYCVHTFDDRQGFGLVCDGMGGQSAGNIASDMACGIITDKIRKAVETGGMEDPRGLLESALREANYSIYKRSMVEPECRGMGTTAVVAFVRGDTAYCAHVGDSRIYLLRQGRLLQVTRDHSLVQELMEKGEIKPEEMRTHPGRNMITRAVGVSLTVEADLMQIPLEPGDKMLLCSDGLTNMVPNEQIAAVLLQNGGEQACALLIQKANNAGGMDNITAVVIE